jgi:hypothetical protein
LQNIQLYYKSSQKPLKVEDFQRVATGIFTPIYIELSLVPGFRCREMTVSSASLTDDVTPSFMNVGRTFFGTYHIFDWSRILGAMKQACLHVGRT